MKTILLSAVAAFTVAAASAASAQVAQIPTPVNPFPANPVATDGTPLYRSSPTGYGTGFNGGLYAGRSVGFDGPASLVGGVVGAGVDTAGAVIGTGLNTTGAIIGGPLR